MSSPFRILLIDDNRSEHKLWTLFVRVKKLPVVLSCYADATEALKDLQQIPEDQFPHAIISDIQMPTMDGFELADVFLKEFHPKFPSTVFCVYSSTIRLADIERAKNHELVSDFIEKPIDEEKFEEYILTKITG